MTGFDASTAVISIPQPGEAMLARNWVRNGMIALIIGDLAYVFAAAPLGLPHQVVLLFGFAFGPLLSLAFVGFYYFFSLHTKSVAIQASVIFGVIAGTVVNMMLVVQSAVRLTIPSEARAGLGLAWDGLNMIQLGLDVSWDIYLSAATMLLGIAMVAHPRFGKIWGGLTIAIGAALLVVNLVTFPIPTAAAGSIDLGPVMGIWYLMIAIRVLTSLKWVDQRIATGEINSFSPRHL